MINDDECRLRCVLEKSIGNIGVVKKRGKIPIDGMSSDNNFLSFISILYFYPLKETMQTTMIDDLHYLCFSTIIR